MGDSASAVLKDGKLVAAIEESKLVLNRTVALRDTWAKIEKKTK